MKISIFFLVFVTLIFSCKPENTSLDPVSDGKSANSRNSASDFVGNWEDADGIIWIDPSNPDKLPPLYQIFDDGTYNVKYGGVFDFPSPGTWDFDAQQGMLNFYPNNYLKGFIDYYWVIDAFSANSANELKVISIKEPLYTTDGVKPDPNHRNVRLVKKP